MKTTVSTAARAASASGALGLLERLDGASPDVLRVLCYHRIARPERDSALYPGTISATPEDFARQIEFVASHWHPISIGDLLAHYRTGAPLPPRSVLVTFDDAYDDFEDVAWPILRRNDTPALLFVPTAYPQGGEFWWDRLYRSVVFGDRSSRLDLVFGQFPLDDRVLRERAFRWLREVVKLLPHETAMRLVDDVVEQLEGSDDTPPRGHVLGWDALRRLAADGVDIGSHTVTHPLLNRVSPERTREEITTSLTDLRRELGDVPPVLAYPSGGFGPETAGVVADAGIEIAFTTHRGVNRVGADSRLLLRRIMIGPRTTEPILRAEMLRWSTVLARWRVPAYLQTPLAPGADAYGLAQPR